MSPMFGPSSPWAREALAFGLDVALKAALVGLLALTLHVLLGRRRVLVRSVLWNACLAGLLVLPAAVAAFPRLQVACLPGEGPGPTRGGVSPIVSAVPAFRGDSVLPGLTPGTSAPSPVAQAPARAAAPSRTFRFGIGSTIVLGYLVVASGLMIRLTGSLVAVWRLRHSGFAIEAGPWVEALEVWRTRLGLRRRVRLAGSARLGVPVVVGWARPTILVPEDLAATVTPRAIDAVLLHELAHVRRGDYAWNLALRLVQALYWPHPLAWVLGKVVSEVREQACDELCIYWMGDSRDYRATLLRVAEGLVGRPRGALGLAMTRSTKLARRLARIARSPGLATCRLRWPARAAIASGVVAAVAVLGSVQPTRDAAAASSQDPPKGATKEETREGTDSRSEREGPAPPPADTKSSDRRRRPGIRRPPVEQEAPKSDTPGPAEGDDAEERGPIREVTVVQPRREPWATKVTLPCALKVINPISVHPQIAGVVSDKALAAAGDRVRQGQTLARVEPSGPSAELEKDREVIHQGQAEVRQARSAVHVAKEKVERLARKLEKARETVRNREERIRAGVEELNRVEEKVQKDGAQEREDLARAKETLREAQSSLKAARASLQDEEDTQARNTAEHEMAESLLKVAEESLAEIVNDARSLENRRREVRAGLGDVLSPIDGVILKRGVEPGSPVRPGEGPPLFVIARTDVLTVPVPLPESQSLLVDRGDPVEINLRALRNQPIRAKVSRIGAEIEKGHLPIEIDIPNPEGRLRPGMSGFATISLEPVHFALTVPQVVLQNAGNPFSFQAPNAEPFCYRVVAGRAVATPLRLGHAHAGRVEVLEGLKAEDRVISYSVENGALVFTGGNNLPTIAEGTRIRVLDLPQPPPEQSVVRGLGGMGGGMGGMGGGMGGMGGDLPGGGFR